MIVLGVVKLTRGYKAGALPTHMVLVTLSAVLGGSKSSGPLTLGLYPALSTAIHIGWTTSRIQGVAVSLLNAPKECLDPTSHMLDPSYGPLSLCQFGCK